MCSLANSNLDVKTSELFAHRNAKHRIIYSCQLNDAVFNPIFSFRDVIFNLYGEYDNETRAAFLGLWQAVGPLLTPHTEPMLANSVCIRPMAASIDKTRGNYLTVATNTRHNRIFSSVWRSVQPE